MADQYAHIDRLTDRERQVLQRVTQGQRTAEISRHLHLKPDSVRVYLRNAMDKLGVRTRQQAAALAIKTGLVDQGRR
jgi:DNA-binding CsgD family transcriptional regulator